MMKLIMQNYKNIYKAVRLMAVITFLMAVAVTAGFSQSSTQVDIVGIPAVLTTPYADDIEQNFSNGRYQVVFNYSSFSNRPVDFEFRFVLKKDNRTLIDVTSLPKAFTPGNYVFPAFFQEILFPQSAGDLINNLDRRLRNQVIQSGSIPEGRYTIEVEARPAGSSNIAVIPGIIPFTVQYPPPPILVTVPNDANLLLETPVFSWTPVVSQTGGLFEYDFLLVEVRRGQTPRQAIESNRAHAQQTISGRTSVAYTPDFLPLDEDAMYAWQIIARDPSGSLPMQNDGQSEIYTFTYKDQAASRRAREDIEVLELLSLVPGFAELNEFEFFDVEETPSSYILNGNGILSLHFNTIGDVQLAANLQNVEIQKTGLQNPVLLGGTIQAEAAGLEELTGTLSDYVELDNVSWTFGQGVSAGVSFHIPGNNSVAADGNIALQPNGLNGTVRATGSPLLSFGETPVRADISEISVSFPEHQIRTKTEATLFGEPLCDVSDAGLYNNNFSINLDCDADEIIPMVNYSDNLVLNVQEITGMIAGSWDEPDLDYSLNISSDIDLKLTDDRRCGVSTNILLSSEDGFSTGEFTPTCNIPRPEIDLGFLHATIKNPEFGNIGLNEDGDGLDFEIEFDTQLFFPSSPDLSLPELEGIRISTDGITFPEIEYHREDLPVNNTFTIGDFDLNLNRFELEMFTFPWFDWDGEGPGPWSFSFDAGLNLPFSANVPGCFSDTELEIQNASVAGDAAGGVAVTGSFSGSDALSCSWDFGPGFSLDIHGYEGSVSMTRENEDFNLQSDFTVDASLNLGSPFSCSTDPVLELDEFTLSLSEGINGELTGLTPDCPVNIGPYSAQITDGSLIFEYSEETGQQAFFDAEASLQLAEDQMASGSFRLNLTNGELEDVEFQISGPFEWGIPKENPVLVFTVDEAILSDEGLYIDGRQSLNVGEEEIGTTFDGLLINWDTYEILDGRIIFDHGFSFVAGLDAENHELQFNTATQDSTLDLSPGVLMELAGTVQIDSLGLSSEGSASAQINLEGLELDELEIEYSEGFAMELEPLGIASGEVDFYWNGNRVAYGDNSGFYPDLSFFAEEFLPERIPLPNEEVAYLQIRDEEEELVVTTTRQDDGSFLIETIEGESLDLVIPVLQRDDESAPPSIQVELDDLVVNPSNGSYISGAVYASVTAENPIGERPNLPVELDEIIFTEAENGAGQEIKALFLSGRLNLFDQTLGEDQLITLYVQSDGLARGGFVLPDAGVQIPLDGPGGRVVIAADSLAGSFTWNPQSPASSDFDIDIQGGFQINDQDGSAVVRSDLGLTYNQYGISVSDFSPGDILDNIPLDLGLISLEIPSIENLSISYDEITGFDYHASLDFLFEINIEDRTIPFPLNDVEIRSDLGFVIPTQDIHDGSVPDLDLPDIDFGVFNLKPLAFRMSRDTLNWNEWSPGDLLDIVPDIDFELSFPEFEESVPSLAQLSLTVLDASFTEGLLAGDLIPLDLSETPIFFPMGSGAGINISQIGGELFSDEGNQQFSINFDGDFEMPEFFSGSGEDCPAPDVSVNLTPSAAIEGTITEFTPCGNITAGPIELAFGESEIEFTVDEDDQTAILTGNVQALLQTEEGPVIEADGDLVYDLLNGKIIDGDIGISSEFTWYYPSADSLFEFQVESASITSDGLVFDAGGSLSIGDGSASVNFQNMTFDLATGALVDGSAEIQNQVAFDVSFGPTSWALVDPASGPDFSQGVRMTVPESVTIDASGLTVDGQSGASLHFGEESYDQLQVDFDETRFTFDSGARISDGQADFILQEEGEEPIRLAWYDSDGFHPDNIAAAVPLPDTLALPSEEIAYIVLRDEQGNNLVQSENVGDGLSISTSEPLQLIIPALENQGGEPQSVTVEFEDIVINAALEMISGSITADLSNSPLNLAEETDFPIGLTGLQYVRESGENFLYADAQLELPGSLSDLDIEIGQLALGPGGFSDVTIALGDYSEQYNAENDQVIVSEEFGDGDFGITVRGIEVTLGSEPSYKFSGDLTSNLLRDEDEEPAILHLAANYSETNWQFIADAEHLVPQRLPIGTAELVLEELEADFSDDDFGVMIDGRFKLPEVIGDDLEIGIEGLRVGTAGVSIDQVNTDAFADQSLSLFGQQDNLTIQTLGLEITEEYHLFAEINGSLEFLDRTFQVSELRIGSDGTFAMGEGTVNLLGEDPVELMSENLVLTTLQLGVNNGTAQLTALADLTLPDPVETESEIGISINHLGEVEIQQPDINFEGVSKEIPGIGIVALTDAGIEINDFRQLDFAIYAMAEIDFEGVNGSIELGQAGSTENWGMRYQYGGSFEWRITNSPEFAFSNEMFQFSIQTAQAADLDNNAFGVNLSVAAGLTLDGIEGSIGFSDMIISTNGLDQLGTFNDASLDLGPASLSLSSFEFSSDGGTLELEQEAQGASDENPEVEIVEITTTQHLRFGGTLTVPGFTGGVEEVLYYRTEEDIYLSVKNFEVDLSDVASLRASVEFESMGGEDFSLKVAGEAAYTPPGGDSIELAALGRMEHIDNQFSFGIFVKADVVVPIIPGILTMNSFGGGFFYKATGNDFDDVLDISGYNLTQPVAPWYEEEEGYDFAIIVYAGVGIIGEGDFVINGEAILMITPDWITLDVGADVFSEEVGISAGMYLTLDWSGDDVQFTGGVVAVIDNAIADGEFGMHFQVIRSGGNTDWAINGGTNPDGIQILNFITFDGTLIAGPTGFYMALSVNYNFDVSIITANADVGLEVWWVRGEQFGAYAEFSADLSLFKGVFKGGGEFKGALINRSGQSLYIFASATVYVDIKVYTGSTTAWIELKNGSLDGGRTDAIIINDDIDKARDEAQSMNDDLNEALDAAEDFQTFLDISTTDEDVIAEAGEIILGNRFSRAIVFSHMLNIENSHIRPTNNTREVELFQAITDVMTENSDMPSRSDYNINTLQSEMHNSIDELGSTAGGIQDELAAIQANTIAAEQSAQATLEDLIQSPVQAVQMDWIGDNPPDFTIDETIDTANQDGLQEYQEEMEQLNEYYVQAISDIYGNIEKLDDAMSPEGANINSLSAKFNETVESIDRFYANLAGYYWDINRWARINLGVYEDIDFNIEEAIINTAVSMINNPNLIFTFSGSEGDQSQLMTNHPNLDNLYQRSQIINQTGLDLDHMASIGAERAAVMYLFADDEVSYNEHKSSEETNFQNLLDNNNYTTFFATWVQRAIEFWYMMPTEGYQAVQENSAEKAEQVYEIYEQNLGSVKEAHVNLTHAIDDIYSTKHSIHATLEEILRQYVQWYEAQYGEGTVAEYEDMKDAIQQRSLPPTITSVSSSSSRTGFVNKFDVSWNATHPSGEVIESSYFISDDSGSDIFDETYMSAGSATGLSRYLFKRDISESSRPLSVNVRARGPSGISIRKIRETSTGLNRPSSGGSSALAYSFMENQAVEYIAMAEPEPPEKPTISLPYYMDSTEQNMVMIIGGNPVPGTITLEEYWSNDTGSLEFTASSFDAESDIAGFEYMIGTSAGGSNITDWTQQTGIPVNGSSSSEQNYTVYGLSLEPGTDYYLTVRAINGAGTKSETTSIGPIKIDETVPNQPGEISNSIELPSVSKGSTTANQAVNSNYTTYQNPPSPSPEDPFVTLRWNGSIDDESGLRRYHIVASENSDPDAAFITGSVQYRSANLRIIALEEESVNFEDEFYFHIRAEDKAGNVSEALTLGPTLVTDPTAPTTPEIVARAIHSFVGFYLKKPAADPETDIQSYSYVFYNGNTGSVINSTAGSIGTPAAGKLGEPTYVMLPASSLPKGVPLVIRVQAVNGQGETSRSADSGYIYHDTTPPLTPSLSVQQNGNYIDINVSNIHDPQSGVTQAQYRVLNGGSVVKGWTNLIGISGVSRVEKSGSKSYYFGSGNMAGITVEVRIRNGNNMWTYESADPVLEVLSLEEQQVMNAIIMY